MDNRDNFFDDDYSHVTLSLELLMLLEWLAHNGEEVVDKVIEFAFKSGLDREIRATSNLYNNNAVPENTQEAIPLFFDMLESLLAQKLEKITEDTARNNRLNTTIEHIDTSACDSDTIHSSVQRATSQVEVEPNKNPRDALTKELLRRWKPHDKKIVN